MTLIVLIVASVVLFFVGVFSPRKATKIQRRANKHAVTLKSLAEWFWNPVTKIAHGGTEFARKSVVKATEWGKKTRKRLPF